MDASLKPVETPSKNSDMEKQMRTLLTMLAEIKRKLKPRQEEMKKEMKVNERIVFDIL